MCASSKRQSLIANSVFEAETIAGNDLHEIILFLRKVFADIVEDAVGPTRMHIYGDNERAVECASKNECGKRSRHFEVRLYHLADGCERGVVCIEHIGTAHNPADLLTKVTKENIFLSLVDKFVTGAPAMLVSALCAHW